MKTVSIALFLAALTSAQDAIVVDIPEAEAKHMAALYDQKAKLDAEIKVETRRIGTKYATWEFSYSVTDSEGRVPPPFEFSKDFRHIVPETLKTSGSGTIWGQLAYPCGYGMTPATLQLNSTADGWPLSGGTTVETLK